MELHKERELIAQAQGGCQKAKTALYLEYENYLRVIARKYYRQGLDLKELTQCAAVGFMSGLYRFDASKSDTATLGQFSSFRIRDEIFNYINMNDQGVRLYKTKGEKKAFCNMSKYEDKNGGLSKDSVRTMVSELNITEDEARRTHNRLKLRNEVDSDPNSSLDNMSSHAATPEEIVLSELENQHTKNAISSALGGLTELQRNILKARYEQTSNKRLTLKELGDQLNVSFQRVGQVEKAAIKKMKSSLLEKHADLGLAA